MRAVGEWADVLEFLEARPASASWSQLPWTRAAASWWRPADSQCSMGDVAEMHDPTTVNHLIDLWRTRASTG